MNFSIFSLIAFTFLVFGSCSKQDNNSTDCGELLLIDQDKYMDISMEPGLFISSPSIEGNCLTITLGYSGCNDGHHIELITSGDVAESYPVQIRFKFLDKDPQACLAFFTQEYQYDLSPLSEVLGTEDKARLIFVQDNQEILWEL